MGVYVDVAVFKSDNDKEKKNMSRIRGKFIRFYGALALK